MENRDDSAYYYVSTELIEYDKPFCEADCLQYF